MDIATLELISNIVGWIYLFAWSVSFYPQVIMNYELKSVEGFHLDYPFLNISGYIFLSISYTVGYFYKETNPHNNYGLGTVRVQDLLFAYHAFVLAVIACYQCFVYERGANKLSIWAILFTIFAYSSSAIVYFISEMFGWIPSTEGFNLILYMGYLKVAVTSFKYLPLVIWNYKRKSTVGFSIGTILFDIAGGTLSIIQNVIDLIDGTTEVLNPIKMALGGASCVYDLILMYQHYILYNEKRRKSQQGAKNIMEIETDPDGNAKLLKGDKIPNETPYQAF